MSCDDVVMHPRPLRGGGVTEARADECPACEGRGGTQRDDWGYEREDCPACSGTGLRAPQGAP